MIAHQNDRARSARKKNEKTKMIAKMIAAGAKKNENRNDRRNDRAKMIAAALKIDRNEMIKMIAACAENRQYLLEFELRGC